MKSAPAARSAWAACLLAAGLLQAPAAQAQLQGLHWKAPPATGSAQWQTRIELDTSPMGSRLATPMWLWQSPPQTMGVMGDLQFAALRLGETGGLRVTGGLLLNLRASAGASALPEAGSGWLLSGAGFAGVGYASGSADGSWGFSADLGLAGLGFGQDAPATTSRAWLLRDLRVSPLLRLGMRLSF